VHIVINLETNLNYNSENKDKISDRVCVYLQLTETSSSSGVQSPLTNINEHTSMEKQLQTWSGATTTAYYNTALSSDLLQPFSTFSTKPELKKWKVMRYKNDTRNTAITLCVFMDGAVLLSKNVDVGIDLYSA